jgi:hypothetical protein
MAESAGPVGAEWRRVDGGGRIPVARAVASLSTTHRLHTSDHAPRRADFLEHATVNVLQGDDDFSPSVSALDVAESRRGLVQRVLPVDDRSKLPGFDKLLQDDQVLMIRD